MQLLQKNRENWNNWVLLVLTGCMMHIDYIQRQLRRVMSSGVFRTLRNSECEINDVQSSVSWLQENSEACRDRIATNGEIVRR